MTGSMPDVTVEIAFNAGYTTPAASRIWTDVTDYVEMQSGITINRGRAEEDGQPQPSRLSLTLANRDGRFTPEYAAGAYYPNVKKGRPIRVRGQWPVGTGPVYDRFTGYIDEWPVEWPGGSDAWSTVAVTASSRMARSARTASFKSIVEEEILYDAPVLYFPLGEPEGATQAGNIAPRRSERLVATAIGVGGVLTFGSGTGPGTDDLTAPTFTPAAGGKTVCLRAILVTPITSVGDSHLEIECFFTTSVTPATDVVLMHLGDAFNYITLSLTSAGKIVGKDSKASVDALGAATVTDGNVHHAAFRLSLNDGTGQVTSTLILDGVSLSPAAAPWPFIVGGVCRFPDYRALTLGAPTDILTADYFDGVIAHATVSVQADTATTDARLTAHYTAGMTGFAAEASGARIARYARLAGIPTAEVSVETGLSLSIAHKDTTGETPVGLMQDVANTEDGMVFDGKDGTLTFHARSHRYGSTSAFTLDAAAGDIEQGLLPKLDDRNLSNDVTASRANGATIRSVNQASIDEYGYYRESVELLTTSDNEVQARADWQVNRFGTPRVTIPNVANDLTSSASAKVTSLLAADIGTRFTVTNLPSQAPAATLDFFIEGITETIGAESYGIELNTSAAPYADVWIWDTSVWDTSTRWAY